MHALYCITSQPAVCQDYQKRKQNWFASLIPSLPMVLSMIPTFFSKCSQTIWLEICFKIWPRIDASIATMKLTF